MDPRHQQPTQPQTSDGPQAPRPAQPPRDPDAFGVQPPVPTPETAQPHQPVSPEMPRKAHKKLALALVFGPSILLFVAFVSTIAASQLSNSVAPDDGTFGDTPVAVTILNLVAYAGMTLGIITWLPGLIIGIILLARKKK